MNLGLSLRVMLLGAGLLLLATPSAQGQVVPPSSPFLSNEDMDSMVAGGIAVMEAVCSQLRDPANNPQLLTDRIIQSFMKMRLECAIKTWKSLRMQLKFCPGKPKSNLRAETLPEFSERVNGFPPNRHYGSTSVGAGDEKVVFNAAVLFVGISEGTESAQFMAQTLLHESQRVKRSYCFIDNGHLTTPPPVFPPGPEYLPTTARELVCGTIRLLREDIWLLEWLLRHPIQEPGLALTHQQENKIRSTIELKLRQIARAEAWKRS